MARRPAGWDPLLDGPPTRKAHGSGLVAILVVVAVVLGVWLVSGGDPGTPVGGGRGGFTDTDSAGSAPAEPGSGSSAPGTGDATDPVSGLPVVALSSLPTEAAQVAASIDAGGPFPYEQDGSTFGNFEGLLPPADRGYYQEFTVETPGSQDRGARRLVEGGDGELYWTADHYESFAAVRR